MQQTCACAPPRKSTRRGRPVGVAIDKTGALLVADDTGNTVWRVSAAHPQLTQR